MQLFDDLEKPFWIHLKGWLFLFIAALAGLTLLLQCFSWTNVGLLLIGFWAVCRWYYYMFYVIEKYVDSSFRFAGIGSAVRYLLNRKTPK